MNGRGYLIKCSIRMDLSRYREDYPFSYKFARVLWYLINRTIFRWMIGSPFRKTRIFLLRLFGAQIPYISLVYHSSIIWAPWNLKMGEHACVGPNTEIYNKALVCLGDHSVISQGAKLYTASHDITDPAHALVTAPIIVESKVWVAADAFVGMGVTIGEGAVVGARAAVFKNVEPWTVVGGNPAKFIKRRVLRDA